MYFGYKDITISYGKKKIIDNVNIDFPKGKITTIIGANGCGKSSLLKIITRYIKADSGYAYFNDKNILSINKKKLARDIAVLPQVHEIPPDVDVRTLASYGRYPYTNFNNKLTYEDNKLIDTIIEDVGLSHLSDQKVSTLSGGERQRAWIAMTICQQPEILVLDEPTSFLDINFQIEILDLIRTLNKTKHITIIMVLHDINLSARYSDFIVAIKNQKVYNQGKTIDVINENLFNDIFDLNVTRYYDKINNCDFFIPNK